MKTDSIFYRLFQSYPAALFELMDALSSRAIGYEFRSVEVKQLAFLIDGVFTSDLSQNPIYFTEVQFQRDDRFFHRTLSEIMLYLGQTDADRKWKFVVLFANRNIEPVLPIGYQILAQNIQVIYLNKIGQKTNQPLGVKIVDLVVCKPNLAQGKVQALLPEVRVLENVGLRESMLDLIETIVMPHFSSLSNLPSWVMG